mgnify:CR=1 FL=1
MEAPPMYALFRGETPLTRPLESFAEALSEAYRRHLVPEPSGSCGSSRGSIRLRQGYSIRPCTPVRIWTSAPEASAA